MERPWYPVSIVYLIENVGVAPLIPELLGWDPDAPVKNQNYEFE